MRDDSFEREIEAALADDDPGPVRREFRDRVAAIPDRIIRRRWTGGLRVGAIALPRRPLLVPLAAVLLVIVLGAVELMVGLRHPPNEGPSVSPTATAVSTVARSSAPSSSRPTAAATAASNDVRFTTPGVTSGWTGFSWSKVPDGTLMQAIESSEGYFDMISWAGGYAAVVGTIAADGGAGVVLVTSSDGETWTRISAVPDPAYVAAGPGGTLLALSIGSSGETIWISHDGVHWSETLAPPGAAWVAPIAGTSTGFVGVTSTEPGTAAPHYSYRLIYSSDGLTWTPLAFDPGSGWDSVWVQSDGDRFFLIAGNSETGKGRMWWSDDGTTWTQSSWSGFCAGCMVTIEFASGGMISWAGGPLIESAFAMEVSHDGGKTWTKDASFGPLGSSLDAALGDFSNGHIGSNGSIFLAVSDAGSAWTSSDGLSWKPITWGAVLSGSDHDGFVVLPRGVLIGESGSRCNGAYCDSLYYGVAR